MLKALVWIDRRGGSGVLDKYSRVLSGGEVSNAAPATWLRLATFGFIEGYEGRLLLTEKGRETAMDAEEEAA
jgi:hypothetical protein